MKLETKNRRANAATLLEAIVVIALIAMLAAVLLPILAAEKHTSSPISCVNNIKQTSLAFEIWSGDSDGKLPAQAYATNEVMMWAIANGNAWLLWQTMSNELSTPKILCCPADLQTTCATNFVEDFRDANISYFFNPDATTNASQMILDGDDNIVANGFRAKPGILRLKTNGPAGWAHDRHLDHGNIGMADGSVEQVSDSGLRSALAGSGTNLVRLVIP
jgi:prepilin-type processing-associated H-X9-DG protein